MTPSSESVGSKNAYLLQTEKTTKGYTYAAEAVSSDWLPTYWGEGRLRTQSVSPYCSCLRVTANSGIKKVSGFGFTYLNGCFNGSYARNLT